MKRLALAAGLCLSSAMFAQEDPAARLRAFHDGEMKLHGPALSTGLYSVESDEDARFCVRSDGFSFVEDERPSAAPRLPLDTGHAQLHALMESQLGGGPRRELLAALGQALAPDVELRVLLLRSRGGAIPVGLLPRAAFEELEAKARSEALELLHVRQRVLRCGDVLAFEGLRKQQIVMDMNVEVAQGAAIADPVIGSPELGTRYALVCAACPEPGSRDVMLAASIWRSVVTEQPKRVSYETKGLGYYEQMSVSGFESLLSRRIPADMALSVDTTADEARPERMLILPTRKSETPELDVAPRAGQPWRIVPSPWLALPQLHTGGDVELRPLLYARAPDSEMLGALSEALGCWDEDNGWPLWGGSFAVLSGAPMTVAQVERLWRAELGPWHSSRVLILTRERKSEEGAWRAAGAPLCLPMSPGRIAYARRGAARNYVGGFDIETTTDTHIADPQMLGTFSGVAAYATGKPKGGSWFVQLRMLERRTLGWRKTQTTSPIAGPLTLPAAGERRFGEDFLLQVGEDRVLGLAAEDGQGGVTRWVLRLE